MNLMRTALAITPALMVLALIALLALALREAAPESAAGPGDPGAEMDGAERPGTPIPDFSLPPLVPPLSAADLRGRVQLVNVFASWCAPCRVEHPVFNRLAEEERIVIHGINFADEPAAARAYLEEGGNPYRRIGVDREGKATVKLGISGTPETLLVDARGRIRWRVAGPVTPELAETELVPRYRALAGSDENSP